MTTAPLADREPQPGTVPRGPPRCGLSSSTTEPHEPSPRRMRFEQLLRRVTYLVGFGVVIATPFEIDIVPAGPGPLPETITVEVSSEYLSMFDENGLDPQPDSATSDGTVETWIYQLDDVMRLHIDFDARLQPNIHSGMTGTVRIAGPGIAPAEVEFRTWVFP